jgi:hypothetical protein
VSMKRVSPEEALDMGPMDSQPKADFLPVIERRFPKEAGPPTSRQAETGRAWDDLAADEP